MDAPLHDFLVQRGCRRAIGLDDADHPRLDRWPRPALLAPSLRRQRHPRVCHCQGGAGYDHCHLEPGVRSFPLFSRAGLIRCRVNSSEDWSMEAGGTTLQKIHDQMTGWYGGRHSNLHCCRLFVIDSLVQAPRLRASSSLSTNSPTTPSRHSLTASGWPSRTTGRLSLSHAWTAPTTPTKMRMALWVP